MKTVQILHYFAHFVVLIMVRNLCWIGFKYPKIYEIEMRVLNY